MKRLLILAFILILFFTSAEALDDSSYYGDGVSLSFSDIKMTLPLMYRSTPSITISTAKGLRTYYFNVELYLDKGVLVYGEPSSLSDLLYFNEFRERAGGYFLSSPTNPIRGEYRYLGLSINGTAYTNVYFPNDPGPPNQTYRIVKYSSLPQYLKDIYEINEDTNKHFSSIRDFIDNPNGPGWDFINVNSSGKEITVYQKFLESGLIEGGNYPSLFEYGRITSWASGGGSIVLYYQSNTDPNNYRYATFNGYVSPAWEKKFIGMEVSVKGVLPTYRISKDETSVQIDYTAQGIFIDNYSILTDLLKDFTYNREDVSKVYINNENKGLTFSPINYDMEVKYNTCQYSVDYYREDLNIGYNIGKIPITFIIDFGSCTYQTDHVHYFSIYLEPLEVIGPTPRLEVPEEEKKDFTIIRAW